MATQPPTEERPHALLTLGLVACVAGLVTVATVLHTANEPLFTGAPSLTRDLHPATSWFAEATLAESLAPRHLPQATSRSRPTATVPIPPVPGRSQRFPGDGIGYRADLRPEGNWARFLRETSQLQTRRGWADAGDVALARFMGGHRPSDPTSTASPP